jgi:hypothetical protein
MPVPKEDAFVLCPVCNGLLPLDASCPNCGAGAEDEGRRDDWSGPYSPYETASRADEMDADRVACPHLALCPRCQIDFVVDVGTWHG